MVKITESMINNIIKLGGSTSQKNQLEATQIMCRNVFPNSTCVDPTTIPKLLPTIVKLMESKFPKVQEEGIYFITVITTTSNGAATEKQNTQHAVNAGALAKLVKCLSSRSHGVLELALKCIANIAVDFPKEILAINGIKNIVKKHCSATNPNVSEQALNAIQILRDARGSDEMEEVEPQQAAETSRSQRQAKRAAAPANVRSNTRNKRAKVSRLQTDAEPDGSVNDNENNDIELYNDFDAPARPQSPIRIILELPNELPPAAAANDEETGEAPSTNATEDIDQILPSGTNDNANPTTFAPFKYYSPSEFFINKCSEELGLQFHRKQYVGFLSKIDFDQITPNLKPAKYLPKKDKSGFSCFSLFFTGNEKNADLIEKKIKEYFVNKLDTLDKEKIKKVLITNRCLNEHVEVIVRMFKCRILIYSNGGWEKFGDWNSDDEMYIPVFVMEKKEIRGKIEYEIILSLKN